MSQSTFATTSSQAQLNPSSLGTRVSRPPHLFSNQTALDSHQSAWKIPGVDAAQIWEKGPRHDGIVPLSSVIPFAEDEDADRMRNLFLRSSASELGAALWTNSVHLCEANRLSRQAMTGPVRSFFEAFCTCSHDSSSPHCDLFRGRTASAFRVETEPFLSVCSQRPLGPHAAPRMPSCAVGWCVRFTVSTSSSPCKTPRPNRAQGNQCV